MRVCPRCRSSYAGKYQFCGIDGARLVEQSEDPLIGEAIGRYRVVAKLGQGASGSVYRAVHTELECAVAVKVLFGDLGADERLVGRFKREAKAASRIRSPHVVQIFDFDTTPQGLTYLGMEYVEGKSLHRIMAEAGPLPPARAARITAHIATGLAAAHRSGLVHRDVKPANVVVLEEEGKDFAKLVDFGIVRLTQEDQQATRLTEMGLVIGTPAYMAPEQAKSSEVGPSADLYSLGVILFEMLSGKRPFVSDSAGGLMMLHAEKPVPPLEPAGGLEVLAQSLLAKEPRERPASASEVVEHAQGLEVSLAGARASSGGVRHASRAPSPLSAPAVPEFSSQARRADGSEPGVKTRAVGSESGASAPGPHGQESGGASAEARAFTELSGGHLSLSEDERAEEGLGSWSEASRSGGFRSGDLRSASETHEASREFRRPSSLSRWVLASVGGALAGLAVWAVIAFTHTNGTSAPESKAESARPIYTESLLEYELESRGLTTLDLVELPDAAPWVERRKTALQAKDQKQATAALGRLIAIVQKAELSQSLLRRKLDRQDKLVAGLRDKLDGDEAMSFETRYGELYRRIQQSEDKEELQWLVKKISEFEGELSRVYQE